MRTVKTSSGATAVQVVWSWRRGSRSIEHIGSAHDEVELAALKAAAATRLAAGQTELDLGLSGGARPGTLPITSSQMTHLWEGLCRRIGCWGSSQSPRATMCFAIWCWRGSSSRPARSTPSGCLTEVGVDPASYATLKRRLPIYAQPRWRQSLAGACARRAGLGPACLVLFDVSTLYFETDAGDGFREPGFSKERRLEPQITLGLLTDASGFPLTVAAFEGNTAECDTASHVVSGSR